MKIAVTGGTGFIGRVLVDSLLSEGHDVAVLSRNPARVAAGRGVLWLAGASRQWEDEVRSAGAVINLAGENIGGGRWTEERKKRLIESRLAATDVLVRAVGQERDLSRVFVSASAIGYYGSRGDEVLTESSTPGDDFLARLTQSWESAALAAEESRRVVVLRFGIVLAADGGALAEMIRPFRLFAGGPVGTGAQWMSWIDRDDAIAMIRWAITNPDARGAFNATAPNPVRNREFAKELGRALHRPSLVRAPAFALRSAFGEMAEALLLSSTRVLPQRAVEAGFQFRVPDLPASLAHVMST